MRYSAGCRPAFGPNRDSAACRSSRSLNRAVSVRLSPLSASATFWEPSKIVASSASTSRFRFACSAIALSTELRTYSSPKPPSGSFSQK